MTRTGQWPGTPPRGRCGTRDRRTRGRPAPGRAPPRPRGPNSMLAWRGRRRPLAATRGVPGGAWAQGERLPRNTVHVNSNCTGNPGPEAPPPTGHRPIQSRRRGLSTSSPPRLSIIGDRRRGPGVDNPAHRGARDQAREQLACRDRPWRRLASASGVPLDQPQHRPYQTRSRARTARHGGGSAETQPGESRDGLDESRRAHAGAGDLLNGAVFSWGAAEPATAAR